MNIKEIVHSPNVADLLEEERVIAIGIAAVRGYLDDLSSRAEWEQRSAESFKLALQVHEEKTYPWTGASNVKFPLVTMAATQFHARAYPALVPPTGLVQAQVFGPDPTNENSDRANRIGAHMTWQMMEESPEWEENHDRALLTLPIVGCVFKKTYFDPVAGRNRHDLVLPKDLVVNYYTTSLDTSPRVTHVLRLTKNDVRERVLRGVYRDLGELSLGQHTTSQGTGELQAEIDEAQGTSRPMDDATTPITLLEQHTWLDLDGDGYDEPYIVTVREVDSAVMRILPRFFDAGDIIRVNDEAVKRTEDPARRDKLQNAKTNYILRINPIRYFTKYGFIPSPDGGFYDLGYGQLLGPINHSINTSINQLIDAGTLQNMGGGFLGPGVSMKTGTSELEPGSWVPLTGRGDDVRKNFAPFPTSPPSQISFALLQLLLQYGERTAGATESMTGVSPGQNTPAETSRNTLEQGMKVFSGIFKRVHRSMKHEFTLVYQLNRIYLDKQQYFRDMTTGKSAMVRQDDYAHDLVNVSPVADPNVISDTQKMQQATGVMQLARETPGFNIREAVTRYLSAMRVNGVDALYPDPKGPNAIPPPPNIKMEIEKIKQQSKQLDTQVKMKLGLMGLMSEAELNKAKIGNLQAQAVKALAEAKGVDTGHAIALIEAQIGAARAHQDGILRMVDIVTKSLAQGEGNGGNGAGNEGMGAAPGNGGSIQQDAASAPTNDGGMGS